MSDSMYRTYYCDRDGYTYKARFDEYGNLDLFCPRCAEVCRYIPGVILETLPDTERHELRKLIEEEDIAW